MRVQGTVPVTLTIPQGAHLNVTSSGTPRRFWLGQDQGWGQVSARAYLPSPGEAQFRALASRRVSRPHSSTCAPHSIPRSSDSAW